MLSALATMLTACSETVETEVIVPISPDKMGAIAVETSLSAESATRAAGKTFSAGDNLIAYVEAGKTVEGTFTSVVSEADLTGDAVSNFSKLLTFTLKNDQTNNNIEVDETTTKSTSFNQTYYWDDFSTLTYDLRSTDVNRGIRLKYAYCYNGGTPSTALTNETGVLEWTVSNDQKTDGTTKSDLLFAPTQAMIRYDHSDKTARGTLVMPFTHAMSQITIEVVCGGTFSEPETALNNTEITLNHMQAKCVVDAPAGTVTPKGKDETGAIVEQLPMYSTLKENVKTFTAIVAPTNLTVGNVLAYITDVAGIPYQIDITSKLLGKKEESGTWASKLTDDAEDLQNGIAQAPPHTRASIPQGKGYRTLPGVNYKLEVHVEKQEITVMATIADWVEVGASTNGAIVFSPNITTKGTINLNDYEWFDVYQAKGEGQIGNGAFDASSEDGINEATRYTYNVSTWVNDPKIYWPNSTDSYYFRALSSSKPREVFYDDLFKTVVNSGVITIKNGDENDNDVIWATTPAETGTDESGTNYSYAAGAALKPRPGDVPLAFKHLLSKVSFTLKTSVDADGNLLADGVDLTGATLQITNVKNSCQLTMQTGATAPDGSEGNLYTDNEGKGRNLTLNSSDNSATLNNQIVTPQTLEYASQIEITLANGTRYKAQLNQCLVTDENGNATTQAITEWKNGEHYKYVITLKKEAIAISAMIQDWTEKTASGNANLEW